MALTWLGIAVAGILFLTAYKGFRRGFIREIVSFFFVFLALAVSWAINPYVNEFFMENTPCLLYTSDAADELVIV